MNPRVITQSLGGPSLATAVMSGASPGDWYEQIPANRSAWQARVESVRSGFAEDWLTQLAPAFDATGKAKARLESVRNGHGVLVTTGQQPGLFGGPVYTLSKALSALALADSLEESTGIPVAPVFWAATDDTDFREASSTVVALPGGPQLLRIDHTETLGRTMASMPLGDVSAQLEALTRAAGSTLDPVPIELLERTYTSEETVGSAYVSFLRGLFAPLGIAVIDASHPATRAAAKPVLAAALGKAADLAARLSARNQEIERAGFAPQVQDVPGLSLVFTSASGGRKRIPIKAATKGATSDDIGPNVLLRPIVERAILPTAIYIGGPAEIAYFAQVSPIADGLGLARPAIVPRWSCMIIEPHVQRILDQLGLHPEDLREPHEVEARVARARLPKRVLEELDATRAFLEERLEELSDAIEEGHGPVAPAVTEGLRANLMRRLDRFERRLIVAAKKQNADVMHEIGTARGSLYPFGKRQERSLNFVPLLARYGSGLSDAMLAQARVHAIGLLTGNNAVELEEAATGRTRS
ncbi:MAG: bacillithiol biosynthesis cysteine-adding enzyme BshC [Gemmatimonadaceae bacterium]